MSGGSGFREMGFTEYKVGMYLQFYLKKNSRFQTNHRETKK